MGENLIKTGYFRLIDAVKQKTSYVSYKEYLNWDDNYKMYLKDMVDKGQSELYCACCRENILELSITSNLVMRVKNNKLQDQHMDSCPKSIVYSHWNDDSKNGISSNEDEKVLFNIALPSVQKSKSSSSSSSSSGSSSSEPKDHRTGILDMVKTLNMLAWEKQTYSKKKEIREANKANLPQTWKYKNLDEFIRLIFGISNQVYARCRGEVIPFIELCYRKDLFYACEDWRMQWFMYAVIEKIGIVKKERKYQYVTVKMPSLQSAHKAVIRVETEHFLKIIEGYEEDTEGMHRILTGYICRRSFKDNETGQPTEWINLLKGIIISVSDNGLYVEDERVAAVANYLSNNRILYKRPYFPLENYGSEIPSFLIERLNDKDLIVDVVSEKLYEQRIKYCEDNEEYECVLITENDSFKEKLDFLL